MSSTSSSTPVVVENDTVKDLKIDGENSGSYSKKFKLPSHFLGGNSLDVAPPSAVKDFVASHDGHTVITKVRTCSILHHLLG